MGIIEQLAEERTKAFVEKLLKQTDFSAEKIAFLADTSVDFVLKIKKMETA